MFLNMGYLAISVLLHERHEMIPLIISSLLKDLQQPNNYNQSLALTTIANIGGKEMAEYLSNEVIKLLMNE
jgi:AP-2 complex subunit alpha